MCCLQCDGVRLDGIGNFHHADCDNPAHHHAHAFSNHGHAADVAIMAAVRAAINAVPGGQSVLLSTEGFADLYNLHGVSTNESNPHCIIVAA